MTRHVSTAEMTTDIVTALVSRTNVEAVDLPDVVRVVKETLAGLAAGPILSAQRVEKSSPAISVRRSVCADHLVCLEDGLKLRSLKQHLRVQHGLTPQQYRARWALPEDYPMAAPNYAKARSDLAKSMGLSQYRKGAVKAR
jgi:predicted transcriptional regulator